MICTGGAHRPWCDPPFISCGVRGGKRPPGQRCTAARSCGQLLASQPFNITWGIMRTLAATRSGNPAVVARVRTIHVMSCAPAFLARRGRHPWRRWLLRRLRLTPGSCRPCGLRYKTVYARPAASVRNGSQSFLLARSRSGQLPLPAPARAVMQNRLFPQPSASHSAAHGACGLRQPAPGRRPSTAQQAAPRPPALIMTVLTWRCSSEKRWYDAAVQAQRPRPGGSVRGQKGASGYRGCAAAEKAQCSSDKASHHAG